MSRLSTFKNAPGAGCAKVRFGSLADVVAKIRNDR